MATSMELFDLHEDSEFKKRVSVQTSIVAYGIAVDGAQGMQSRKAWAKASLEDPRHVAEHMLVAVLAAHEALEPDAIIALTDEEIRTTILASVVAFE